MTRWWLSTQSRVGGLRRSAVSSTTKTMKRMVGLASIQTRRRARRAVHRRRRRRHRLPCWSDAVGAQLRVQQLLWECVGLWEQVGLALNERSAVARMASRHALARCSAHQTGDVLAVASR